MTDRTGSVAISARRPALSMPGANPAGDPRPELFLAVFPPWFRLAYRLSGSFRDMVDELLMEGPF